jgi:hypothetical protein
VEVLGVTIRQVMVGEVSTLTTTSVVVAVVLVEIPPTVWTGNLVIHG